MRKPTHKEIIFAGTISICNRMLSICCKEFPKESGLLHHKTKRLVNALIEHLNPLITLTRSEKLITEVEKIEGFKIDKEDLTQDDELNIKCIQDFTEILMKCRPSETFALSVALDNLKRNKIMYTEEEVEYLKNK